METIIIMFTFIKIIHDQLLSLHISPTTGTMTPGADGIAESRPHIRRIYGSGIADEVLEGWCGERRGAEVQIFNPGIGETAARNQP